MPLLALLYQKLEQGISWKEENIIHARLWQASSPLKYGAQFYLPTLIEGKFKLDELRDEKKMASE